jgi:DNA-binding beta-propeller fold protein YncE
MKNGVTIAFVAALACGGSGASGSEPVQQKAPELDGGVAWFNTDGKPVKMAELRGKVVLLDFWTFCCINCMHVFPDLKRLERKYAKELVVIGVHSAKFKNEKDSDNIRNAIIRHGIEHAVVNDADFKLFTAFGAKGWPHFVLVDPNGFMVHSKGGEGQYEVLDKWISEVVAKFGDKIDRKPFAPSLERAKMKDAAILYPGKILATADRLYISDTGHNRVLVTEHGGKVLEVVGGPDEGLKDGDFTSARFYMPQGLALRGEELYVADTENHSIRLIDLKEKTVKSIAGTGQQTWNVKMGGDGLQTGLNSPWDLALDGDRLYIAMAGDHQIWVMDLKRGGLGPFSGSGREDILDGVHAAADFAQPSGISIQNGKIYVADSEVSGIREVDLDPAGKVRTLVGKGLFEFGDKDGVGDTVRLQHCIGVHAAGGKIYVADSYNHKIKVADPVTRLVKTLAGDGKHGPDDGAKARFYEPSGLWAVGDRLFVADQNNHAIRVVDLKTAQVTTVPIEKR